MVVAGAVNMTVDNVSAFNDIFDVACGVAVGAVPRLRCFLC